MLKSMTGYGRGSYEIDGREYIAEIRSVNHKYSDISIKLPRSLSFLEENIKKSVLAEIHRGKIDVSISFYNNSEKGKEIKINKELAKVYLSQINELTSECGIDSNVNIIDILRLPDVLAVENKEDEDLLWQELSIALSNAIQGFNNMRATEGAKMAEDFKIRINSIDEKINEISEHSAGLVQEYITKLEDRIKELLKTDIVDQSRLAQEVVIFSDKSSIQEEMTRLRSHLSQFLSFIDTDGPIGKKMDFLVQEMNRETNTIGSKANKLEITRLVVEIKTIIEDIREQVQNIE